MSALTWGRVNLDEGWWFIPDPKNRISVTFPLSQVAVEILKKRLNSNHQYVFPGRSGLEHIKEARRTFDKVSNAIGEARDR
jgi:integrase